MPRTYQRWSLLDIELLKKLHDEGKLAKDISVQLKRSFYSICHRKRQLELVHRHWSNEEDEKLRAHYSNSSINELLDFFPHRNWKAIQTHAERLGVKRPKPSKESLEALRRNAKLKEIHLDEKLLRELYLDKKFSTRVIALMVNTSHHTVRKELKKIGIKIRGRLESLISKPTLPELRFITICEKLGLPFKYVGNGAFNVGNLNPDFIDAQKQIAVEIFSDYWHNPLLNRHIKPLMLFEIRKRIFRKYGWKCVIFWSNEIMSSKADSVILNRLGGI